MSHIFTCPLCAAKAELLPGVLTTCPQLTVVRNAVTAPVVCRDSIIACTRCEWAASTSDVLDMGRRAA